MSKHIGGGTNKPQSPAGPVPNLIENQTNLFQDGLTYSHSGVPGAAMVKPASLISEELTLGEFSNVYGEMLR